MMSPIGAIALATIFDLKTICKNELEACEQIEKDLDTFSDKLDKVGEILFGEREEKEEEPYAMQERLQELQKHKREFYKNEYLPLVEKFNKYGVEYVLKKRPAKEEHTLAEDYDSVELERIIKKQYSDIKVYNTITMMRCDVFFSRKITKKREKEIEMMLDKLHGFLRKKIVKKNGKLKKEVQNEFK